MVSQCQHCFVYFNVNTITPDKFTLGLLTHGRQDSGKSIRDAKIKGVQVLDQPQGEYLVAREIARIVARNATRIDLSKWL